jgi:hypothetical protein
MRNEDSTDADPETLMINEIERERHRLHESKMLLLLKAEAIGLTAPRSCCPHPGAVACPDCASDWLVTHLGAGPA